MWFYIALLACWTAMAYTRYRRYKMFGKIDDLIIALKVASIMTILFGFNIGFIDAFDKGVLGSLVGLLVYLLIHMLFGKYKWTI